MPRYIIKLADHYLEWSTIVDAPVTYGMSLDEFRDYYRAEYGEAGMRTLDERLARVERRGHSCMLGYESVEELVAVNRAGPGETQIPAEEITRLCVTERRPVPGKEHP